MPPWHCLLQVAKLPDDMAADRELLASIARTSLRTKLQPEVRCCAMLVFAIAVVTWRGSGVVVLFVFIVCLLAGAVKQDADMLTDIVTDAVLAIRHPETPIDLHMVELMHVCRSLLHGRKGRRGVNHASFCCFL